MHWVLALALVTTPAAAQPPASEARQCAVFDATATGRPGHSANPNPDSAPHRLIRALDRLARRAEAASYVFEIVDLAAGGAINSVPARATARFELRFEEPRAPAVEDLLAEATGGLVELERAADACRPRE